jgi:hypothetical protein
VSHGGCCHKHFLLLVVGPRYSACKLLVCPSKLMQSNLASFSPLRHPFSFSVLVPSHGACHFLGDRTVPHEFILCLSKSSKSLGDEKKLSINILCPKLSTLQVKYLTVVWVAVMSAAGCESLAKYTHIICIVIYHRVCQF